MSKKGAATTTAKKWPIHSDVAYVEQFDVGEVICKGLAVVARTRPGNPVEYLAQWLLAYQREAQAQKQVSSLFHIKDRWTQLHRSASSP